MTLVIGNDEGGLQKFNFHSIRFVLRAVAFLVTVWVTVCLAPSAHADTKTQAFTRSVELFSKGDYVKSRQILIALVKRDRKNSLYWFNLGNSFFMLGDHKKAIACYRQVEKLKSPLTPAARLYQAKAWSASGKTDKSLELTLQVINDPRTPPSIRSEALKDQKLLIGSSTASESLSPHEKALEQYRNGRFSEVIESLDNKTIEQDEDLATLKAMALIKLSRRDEAYQILKRLGTTNANRERIEILNRLINEKKSETYIKSGAWFYLDPSIGYTTNASFKSETESPDSSLLYRFTFGAGRKVVEFSETTSLLFSYAGQIDLIQSLPGNFSHSHQVQTYVDFGVNSWIIQLGPVFEMEKIEIEADQLTLQRLGTRTRVRQFLLQQNHEWGAELTYFHQTNPLSEQSDLNGNLMYARLFYGLISFPLYAQIFLDITQNNTAELTSESVPLPNAYQGTAPGLRLVWKHSGNWISSYQVRHETRRYSALTPAGQNARSDQETGLAFRLAKLWKPTLSTYLTLGHNMNSSVISQLSQQSESYNASTLFLGLQWDLVK